MLDFQKHLCALDGVVYRFATVQYANKQDLLAGYGAMYQAGRWNPKGSFRAVYTSLQPETALSEVEAHYRYYELDFSDATPLVLTSIKIKLQHTIDVTSGSLRNRLKISLDRMRKEDWRRLNRLGQTSLTQSIGQAMFDAKVEAAIVPSFAMVGGANLVIFPENIRPDSILTIAHADKLPQ